MTEELDLAAVAERLVGQERARQDDDWQTMQREVEILLGASPDAVVTRLLRDLTSLSSTALCALAEIEDLHAGDGEPTRLPAGTTNSWQSATAKALRSARAAQLALSAGTPAPSLQRMDQR